MIDAHREKYHPLYRSIAEQAATQSVAQRRKVGCCIVTDTGMIAIGWNGMPSGLPNACERSKELAGQTVLHTDPRVIHAERNALDKLTREGVSPKGSLVFVTCEPCLECAKSLYAVGVRAVHFRDAYHDDAGGRFLLEVGVDIWGPRSWKKCNG